MRCPTCGVDNPYYHGQDTQQDYFHRMLAQQSNMNQLGWGAGSLNGEYHRAQAMQNAANRAITEGIADPPTAKPLTAWQQFKALVHEVFP